jgi:hypothetical protein
MVEKREDAGRGAALWHRKPKNKIAMAKRR